MRRPRVEITRFDLRRRQSSLSAKRGALPPPEAAIGGARALRQEGGTGPRAERRLRGRGARCGNRQGGGRAALTYTPRSLLTWQRERSSARRVAALWRRRRRRRRRRQRRPQLRRNPNKNTPPRLCKCRRAAAELYRSRMLIRALSVRALFGFV